MAAGLKQRDTVHSRNDVPHKGRAWPFGLKYVTQDLAEQISPTEKESKFLLAVQVTIFQTGSNLENAYGKLSNFIDGEYR